MLITICPQRQSILDARGPVLVTGGPGSGKTTIALEKSRLRIEEGLALGQSVLFLSFSRNAVSRIVEASRKSLPRSGQQRLSIQTFHSFFWDILRAYGYLLGAPRSLTILLPHDEDALRHLIKAQGMDWTVERNRLFSEEGVVAFDLFAESALRLLRASSRLRSIYSMRHPLIIVDEAQDTAEDQWQCVRYLSSRSQLVCLADLEQQIFDFRPGVSSERVAHIMEALNPLRIDLQGENHRSPNSEILQFANDVLLETPRGSAYKGVSRMSFRAQKVNRDRAIRQAVGIAINKAKESSDDIGSLALLTARKRGVNVISRALVGDGTNKEIRHKVLIDEAPALLSSRMIAFLLEPRAAPEGEISELCTALELAANVFRSRGGKSNLEKGQQLAMAAAKCRGGMSPAGVAAKLLACLRQMRAHRFTGDPKRDWVSARESLRDCGAAPFREIAAASEELAGLQRSKRIGNGLAELWQTNGSYNSARTVLDAIVAEVQLFESQDDLSGIHVMTMHKSKGKEFDAVVLFDDSNSSPFVFFNESQPHTRCRRLLRVGITRARHHVLLLTDAFNPTELLRGHRL